jgi:hypothetical protein
VLTEVNGKSLGTQRDGFGTGTNVGSSDAALMKYTRSNIHDQLSDRPEHCILIQEKELMIYLDAGSLTW